MSAQQKTPLNAVEQLAVIIRQHRVDRDLTLHDVADRCGVKVSAVRAWEHAELVPTAREWARLCNLVHRALRGHANVWQAARAQITTPGDAAVDARKVATYIEQEPTRQDAVNVSAIARDLPVIVDALSIGEAIRRARVIEGMTQDEFGEIISVTGQAVSAWERGEQNPVIENFDRLVQLVPEIERWRAECRDMKKPMPGPKPEGFTTAGNTHGRQSVAFLPMPQLQLAAAPDPDGLSVEEAGAQYGTALLGVAAAKRALVEHDAKRVALEEAIGLAHTMLTLAKETLDRVIADEVKP